MIRNVLKKTFIPGECIEGWFPIQTKSGSANGELCLKVQFVSVSQSEKSYDVSDYKAFLSISLLGISNLLLSHKNCLECPYRKNFQRTISNSIFSK